MLKDRLHRLASGSSTGVYIYVHLGVSPGVSRDGKIWGLFKGISTLTDPPVSPIGASRGILRGTRT